MIPQVTKLFAACFWTHIEKLFVLLFVNLWSICFFNAAFRKHAIEPQIL